MAYNAYTGVLTLTLLLFTVLGLSCFTHLVRQMIVRSCKLELLLPRHVIMHSGVRPCIFLLKKNLLHLLKDQIYCYQNVNVSYLCSDKNIVILIILKIFQQQCGMNYAQAFIGFFFRYHDSPQFSTCTKSTILLKNRML